MKPYVKSGMLAGIVLFFWGAFSWMVLPWHGGTLHQFTDSKAVVSALTANAKQSGIYVTGMDMGKEGTQQAFAFASVHLEGMPSSMVPAMIISLLIQAAAAIIVAYMLNKTSGLTYIKRVKFVFLFGLAAALVTYLPYWNWFRFDITYTVVMMADLLIGWLLAGLVLARFNRS
jgi:hypothetical protein